MKRLTAALCIALGVATATDGMAADPFTLAIEGPYLLIQANDYQRVLTFHASGAVVQVSDQQAAIGFTAGQGAWTQVGADHATARVVDFSYDLSTGKRAGPSVIVYDLNFSDLADGKYAKVAGSLSGKVYPPGENPLNPAVAPVRTFSVGFTGQRMTAK